jgi:hypothetical protein
MRNLTIFVAETPHTAHRTPHTAHRTPHDGLIGPKTLLPEI